MCEHCIEHNKGIWYLKKKNYQHEKAAFWNKWVMERLINFLDNGGSKLKITNKKLDPYKSGFRRFSTNTILSRFHSGQVIPFEHALAIARMSDDIALGDCICRKYLKSEKKEGVCLLFNMHAKVAVRKGHLDAKFIDLDTCVEHLRRMRDKGCYHSVWTGPRPFVAVICSCTPETCLGHQFMERGIKAGMRKGKFYAKIDEKKCNNCGKCVESCYFGAIEEKNGETIINRDKCFGCGKCVRECRKKAIELDRRDFKE